MRHLLATLVVAFALIFAPSYRDAEAQAPRTLKIVVPFAAGDGADLLVRALAERIGKTKGVLAVIENHPDATSESGTEAVAQAAPDGNTVLLASNSFLIHPNFKKLSYDPLKSFEPVCMLTISPQVIVVNSNSPYRVLSNLIDIARVRALELSNGSIGPATAQQVGFEQLKLIANVQMVNVPFNGNGPALNALLGNRITVAMLRYTDVAEQITAGELRALAVASKTRIPALPNVPTVAELGYSGYEADSWFGLLAPAKTPKSKVSELAQWCAAGIKAPELKPELDVQGLIPVGSQPAEFATHLKRQSVQYARVIHDAGIKGE